MATRKQISGNGFVDKGGAILFIVFGGLGLLGDAYRGANMMLDIILILFFCLGCFLAFQAFKKTHPVYFDDNAFYWKKSGVEHTAAYSHVISLVAYSEAGRSGKPCIKWLELNYTDSTNLTCSISFYTISVFKTDPIWLLVQCEKAIQVKRPEFLITGYTVELKAEKEIENNRKFKLH